MRSFIFASLFAVTLVSPTLALQNSRRSHQRVRQALDLDLGLHLRVDASSDSSSDAETATSTIAPSSSAVPSITATSTALPVSTSGLYGVGDGNKYATIHFMIGNTYTYRLADWMVDLTLIEEAGFDAVALNLGPDCWQKNSVDLAYEAAAKLNTKLKLFYSFDMSTFGIAGDSDAATIASYINQYADNDYTFKYNGLPFVSTFSGDQYSLRWLRLCPIPGTLRIYFVPGFFFPNNQTIEEAKPCIQGLFQWNSAWSTDGTAVNTETDLDWMTQLGPNYTYMAGISPTFFTHYGEDSLNKNWVYAADNNYAKRWEQVANISAPLVEVITWNDYGESHYISPRPSSVQVQPVGTTWVNGNNHSPWARITKPYVQIYKTGAADSLGSDLIIWEYRTHPALANATSDPLDPEAGLNHFSHPFSSGGLITIGMWRNGTNVGGTLTGERAIVEEPELYDYNPVVEQFWHDPGWEACA
ncbi:glycosyl hydrolase family 71-domain-containing protein [Mucidula mucida]|nr:glycosyl hydrolase family 71-domain-containing protein [Mucidula mucida]